jgi:ribosome-associated protein
MIEINRWLSIPESELRFSAARSSGPGGQHVNKVSTRVILEFDVEGSPTLSSSQRQRIRDRMGARLGRDGRLRLSCQRHRSQAANRREVVERFANLLREALKPRRRAPWSRAEEATGTGQARAADTVDPGRVTESDRGSCFFRARR